MAKIKILFVTHSLGVGGAEKVFHVIMKELNKSMFEVECILLDGVNYNFEKLNDVKIVQLREKNNLKRMAKLYSYVKNSNPSIVIGTVLPVSILLPAIKLLLRSGNIKYILRESTVYSSNIKIINGFKRLILNTFSKALYRYYDHFICQCLDIKLDLVKTFGIPETKLTIINNPVAESNMMINSKRNNVANLVTVGRMRKEKGYERVIEVLNLLKNRFHFPFIYTIVGDGDETVINYIKQKIKEYGLDNDIIFAGHSDEPIKYLLQADLFLQGSYFEGFPNAVLEAVNVGLPVLAFDVKGGTKDIIRNGLNGFLINDGNIEEYAYAVVDAIKYNFDKHEISNDAKKRFNMKDFIKKYETLFVEISKG